MTLFGERKSISVPGHPQVDLIVFDKMYVTISYSVDTLTPFHSGSILIRILLVSSSLIYYCCNIIIICCGASSRESVLVDPQAYLYIHSSLLLLLPMVLLLLLGCGGKWWYWWRIDIVRVVFQTHPSRSQSVHHHHHHNRNPRRMFRLKTCIHTTEILRP